MEKITIPFYFLDENDGEDAECHRDVSERLSVWTLTSYVRYSNAALTITLKFRTSLSMGVKRRLDGVVLVYSSPHQLFLVRVMSLYCTKYANLECECVSSCQSIRRWVRNASGWWQFSLDTEPLSCDCKRTRHTIEPHITSS